MTCTSDALGGCCLLDAVVNPVGSAADASTANTAKLQTATRHERISILRWLKRQLWFMAVLQRDKRSYVEVLFISIPGERPRGFCHATERRLLGLLAALPLLKTRRRLASRYP